MSMDEFIGVLCLSAGAALLGGMLGYVLGQPAEAAPRVRRWRVEYQSHAGPRHFWQQIVEAPTAAEARSKVPGQWIKITRL